MAKKQSDIRLKPTLIYQYHTCVVWVLGGL